MTGIVTPNIMDITKPRYERRGDCNQCGKCCVDENCEYFENNKCMIFGKSERPERCLIYPANPPLNYKECSYYFWDKWENKEIRYGDKL